MDSYHKINSIFMRDLKAPKKPFIVGEFCDPAVEYLKDCIWEWTEKIDGTNLRVLFDSQNITFKGKTDNSQIPAAMYEKLQKTFLNEEMINKLKNLFVDTEVCFYGEGFGHKIQEPAGSKYLGKGLDLYLFDIKIGDWWLQRKDVLDIANKLGLLPPVVVGYGTIDEAINFVKNGFISHFGDAPAEGLVLRPMVDLFDRKGQRIITKIKTVDFK